MTTCFRGTTFRCRGEREALAVEGLHVEGAETGVGVSDVDKASQAGAAAGSRAAAAKPLAERMVLEIREAIERGRFKPGARLVEGRIAAMHGVSRNPVREALKTLANEGLVTILPNRGAVVSRFSDQEAAEALELRAALEGVCARLAARRLSPEAAADLESLLHRGEARDAARERHAGLSDRITCGLARAAANGLLSDVLRTLRIRTHWLSGADADVWAAQHRSELEVVLRAVLDRDEERAERLARDRLTRMGDHLLQLRAAQARPDRPQE